MAHREAQHCWCPVKLLCLLRRGQRSQQREMNATPGTDRVPAPLRVPAHRCQPSLRLHRSERGCWRGGWRLPHPFPTISHPTRLPLPSSAGAHPAAPLFAPSQSVATKTPVKAKPSTGGLAGSSGRLVGFGKLQTAWGGRGRPVKTRRNAKRIGELKGGQRRGPSEAEGESSGDPAATRRGWERCLPLRGEGSRDPCAGMPGQPPAAMPQGTPTHPASLHGAEEAEVPARLSAWGRSPGTPALPSARPGA